MSMALLERIEADIPQLSLPEQLQLLEYLARQIRSYAMPAVPAADHLALMAADPEIQRELAQIDREFARTELDGLREGS